MRELKKNILIVTGVFPPEPVTSACMNFDLAVSLSDKYNVTVLHPKPTRPLGIVYDESPKKTDVPFKEITLLSYTSPQSKLIGRFKESISFGFHVIRYIRKNKDQIDFIYNAGWQLFSLFLIARTAKKAHIPYMVPIQDIYPESLLTKSRLPKFLKHFVFKSLLPLDRYYLKNAAKIRTISNEMVEYLSQTRQIDRTKFLVVNNWQDDENFVIRQTSQERDSFVFAYVGSINIHSNVELLIRAFHQANLPNTTLRIIGGGNKKNDCVKLARELKANHVTFDFVAKAEIPEVQSNTDVLILALPPASGDFCVPSKLTSYMLSEKPILASVDPDSTTARYIAEAECGIRVCPDNMEELVVGYQQLYNMSRQELIQMGQNAGRYARANLSKSANLGSVVKEIEQLINNAI